MTTQSRINELLSYDENTGIFTRKVSRGGQVVGSKAGTKDTYGYLQIAIDGKLYLAHRLAWLSVKGEWPKNEIDHINGVRSDNRLCNLRVATRSENMANLHSTRKDSTTNVHGVSKKDGKFVARIQRNGVREYLGAFDNLSEAKNAYMIAATS